MAAGGELLDERSGAIVQGWVTAIGGAAFALGVMHAAGDRAGAWWSIEAILSLSVTAALLALWLRLPGYVFVSGLLLNAAGVVAWLAWEPATIAALLQINVLCLAAGSIVWSLLEAAHREGVPHWGGKRGQSPFVRSTFRAVPAGTDQRLVGDCPLFPPLCFAHWAAVAAVGLLAAYVAAGVAGELFRWQHLQIDIGRMDWIALGATVAAVAVCLWNRNARFVLAGEYMLGLSAVGMALCASCLAPRLWCWWAASALPAFAMAAAALGWLLPRMKSIGRLLRIPIRPSDGRSSGSRRCKCS